MESEGRQEVEEHIEPFPRKVFCCVLSRGLPTMSWCSLQNHLQVGYGLQKQVGEWLGLVLFFPFLVL